MRPMWLELRQRRQLLMKDKEIYTARKLYIRARKQRNATTNDQDFDYWQGIMDYQQEILATLLKTGETNGTNN